MPPRSKELYRRFPKVDLHCHLDGSLRWETVRELAPGMGVRLPSGAPESLRTFRGTGPGCRTLDAVLEMFKYLVPVLRSGPSLERAAFELLEDCAADGIRYVEVRYCPTIVTARGFTAEASVEAVLKGVARGRKATGIEARVILCMLRGEKAADSRETLRLARKFLGKGVAALDLAGTESQPSAAYASYFERAREAGLALTCHAGETGSREHLESALSFGVTRIGHGTLLAKEPKLLEEVRRRDVCLEVSLSSNLDTGAVPSLDVHPFLEFHRSGAAVSLSTDDKGVFDIDLSGEYALAAGVGASFDELADMALAGAAHAFLPPAAKRTLTARIRRDLAALRKEALATAGSGS